MNKLIITFCLLISAAFANSQEKIESPLLVDGKLFLDSVYSNKDELIIFSGIHKLDSLNSSVVKNKIKNWASLNFVSLKDVLVSETDDQIVMNYITSSFYVKSLGTKSTIQWYIRLLIQIKDGRARFTYYDDGNVRMLPSQYSAGVQARTYKLKSYFSEKNGAFVCGKMYTQGMVELLNSIKGNFESVLVKQESSKKLDDNW